MKTKLLLCVFSLMAVAGSFAQDVGPVKVIEFDFESNWNPKKENRHTKVLRIDNIEEGQYYQVVVKNINLNLYKVSLSAKDTILSSEQRTPTFADINLDELSKIIAGITEGNIAVSNSIGENLINQGFIMLDPFKSSKDEIELSDLMKREKDTLEMHVAKVKDISIELDNIKMAFYKTRLSSQRDKFTDFDYNYDKAIKEIDAIREKIQITREHASKSFSRYKKLVESKKAIIDNKKELTANDKSIRDSYAELEKTLSATADIVSADKSFELLSSLVYLEDNKDKDFVSLPFQLRGDQSKLTLSIVPRDEKFMKQTYNTTLVFPYKIRSYTNIGISFYGATLHDQTYTLTKTLLTDSTATYSVTEGDYSKAEMGISALLRYGKKWDDKNCFGAHFSFGAGMSIANKIKPRVMAGGGISLGRKHMFALDIGAIAGYRDRIHKDIKLDSPYPEEPTQILVSKLGVGVFGAIGYIFQF